MSATVQIVLLKMAIGWGVAGSFTAVSSKQICSVNDSMAKNSDKKCITKW